MHTHDTFRGQLVDGYPGVAPFREGIDGELAQVAFVDQGLEGFGGMSPVAPILAEDVAQSGQMGAEHGFPGVDGDVTTAARRQPEDKDHQEDESGRGQGGAAQ